MPELAVFRKKINPILEELYDLLNIERPEDVFSRTSSESPLRSETQTISNHISEQEEE